MYTARSLMQYLQSSDLAEPWPLRRVLVFDSDFKPRFLNSESSHFKPVLISTHQSLIMELLREYLQLYCMVCSVQRIPSGQPSVVAPGWPACWSGVCSLSASCPPTLSSRPSDEAMFLYLLHTPTIKFIFSSCYPVH